MCLHPIEICRKNPLGKVSSVVVPCGNCEQCRASYQSKFAALSVLECLDYASVAFVTLTYDQDHLPVALSECDAELEDGFVQPGLRMFAFQRGSSCHYWQRSVWKKDGCSPLRDDDGLLLCPTLYREDVKNLLKRFRSAHPDKVVRFACFGEYGEQFHRPHYHCLLYGFDNASAAEFVDKWHLGFTDYKIIPAFNPDGSSGYNAVSSYVSKYIGKGTYLPDFVLSGYAQKPRRQSSQNFGLKYVDNHRTELENFTLPVTVHGNKGYRKLLNAKNTL